MSNTSTTQNSLNTLPLTNERKNTIAPVLDNPENIEGIDRAGWFDEDPIVKGFDATVGSINFNDDKVVSPSVVSEIFSGSDQWISIKATDIANKTAAVASKTVNVVGDIASAGKDAGVDLFNQIIGKNEAPETPSDPKKQEEENKKIIENQYVTQTQQDIADTISSIQKFLANEAQITPLKQEVSKLTGLPEWLTDIVSANGEIRTDLIDDVDKAKKAILESQKTSTQVLSSASKTGGQGANLNQNQAAEGASQLSTFKQQ